MRRLLPIAVAAACAAATPVLAAAPLTGLWRMEDDNVRVRIVPCGQSVCGRVAAADKLRRNPQLKDKMNSNPALRNRPVRNMLVMWGFKGGPDKWTGGKIYNPDDGKTYKSEMTLANANTLEVKGCVFKPLCKSTTLTRLR